ncbi:patatin family protein [Gordonibacter sp. An230]|uniref:patatin-like phospholipase family protein n=1 Tax=Gordonibacter sp. An230 TaxID=1965592 RepID=UPI000B3985EE|nr:patatin family protein [Gordonibacter sp. An230]OUO87772.1 patatin family protein [Gordonibacter sp. An230]
MSTSSDRQRIFRTSPASLHEPAWRGHAATDANLVLEGGAMRGQFTAGVLDFFMDQKLFCKRVIGVSAGALCGYNYVAGEDGRTCYLNTKYCTDWRYLSLKSFVRTGNACGREFAFDEIPNRLEPFNYAAFDESPMRLITVSSNLITGEADYHELSDARADLPYLIASSSMPLVSQIVDVDGKLLLDGGTCDSVPIVHSLLTGAKKHVVVLTQAADYVKGPDKMLALERQRYGLYPYYLERLQHRHYEYNRTYRMLARMHEAGEAFVIRPPEPVTVSSMERDSEKLFALYEQGYAEAARTWSALCSYLER